MSTLKRPLVFKVDFENLIVKSSLFKGKKKTRVYYGREVLWVVFCLVDKGLAVLSPYRRLEKLHVNVLTQTNTQTACHTHVPHPRSPGSHSARRDKVGVSHAVGHKTSCSQLTSSGSLCSHRGKIAFCPENSQEFISFSLL